MKRYAVQWTTGLYTVGPMIDHLSSYATDFLATKRFYDAVLPVLGYERVAEMVAEWDGGFPTRRLCAYGPALKACFWVIEVKEPVTPRHVAFAAKDRAAVDAFHRADMARYRPSRS